MSGYKLKLSEKEEVGIKDIYYLNKCFSDIEDEYNVIRMGNSKGGNL